MTEETRIVRLGAQVDRDEADNEGTRVARIGRATPGKPGLSRLFDAHQRLLARALHAEQRPGVMAFVLDAGGIEGSMWLAATDEPRSGTIGRHGCADLHLPRDPSLSLRHCVVLVRRRGDGVRLDLVDLGSSGGLRLEDGTVVRAVCCDGPLLMEVSGSLLACFPTGAPLPWDPDAVPASRTLAPRRVCSVVQPPKPVWSEAGAPKPLDPWHGGTRVTALPGPRRLAGAALLEVGESPVGWLEIASPMARERIAVGQSALESGVLLGRYDRCAGCDALGLDSVSRVHALLLLREERLLLVDAGSMNGTWRGEEELRCATIEPEVSYGLGQHCSIVWKPVA